MKISFENYRSLPKYYQKEEEEGRERPEVDEDELGEDWEGENGCGWRGWG